MPTRKNSPEEENIVLQISHLNLNAAWKHIEEETSVKFPQKDWRTIWFFELICLEDTSDVCQVMYPRVGIISGGTVTMTVNELKLIFLLPEKLKVQPFFLSRISLQIPWRKKRKIAAYVDHGVFVCEARTIQMAEAGAIAFRNFALRVNTDNQ